MAKKLNRSGIYLITIGGERYVGQAVSFDERWARHSRELKEHCHHNQALQQLADRGYKPKFSILVSCPRWQLNSLEAFWGRIYSTVPQRLPKASLLSYLPAFDRQTIVDWVMILGFAIVTVNLVSKFVRF